MHKNTASFRDPSGFVYEDEDKIFRSISEKGRGMWEAFVDSTLCKEILQEELLVPFKESGISVPGAWKTVQLEKLPFISYPYEWCFSQLKDAALLTLALQKKALQRGFIVKDASAYNIQFTGAFPIFIDHLSFITREPNKPWGAYRQFCSHFLAPLSLMAYCDIHDALLLRLWMDGIPLDFAAAHLPMQSKFHLDLQIHIFWHARLQKKYADTRHSASKAKSVRISENSLCALTDSLVRTVEKLHLPTLRTEWGDYYADTNYSDESEHYKADILKDILETGGKHGMGVDLGANTGRYSKILAQTHDFVLAADIDPLAVERHYLTLKSERTRHILPLVVDLGNPSPGTGCNNNERTSFLERCKGDTVLALALIHHLTMNAGIPFKQSAEMFDKILNPGGRLVLEFVPKEDSQVQRLLALREDIFPDYTQEGLLHEYGRFFEWEASYSVGDSARTIIVFKKRNH